MSGPNGRARIEAVLQGRRLDRPPLMLWRHWPVDDGSGEALAQSTLAFQRAVPSDIVKVTPAQTAFAEMWGGASAYTGDPLGTRTFVRRAVNSLDEWSSVVASRAPSFAPLAAQVEAVGRIRQSLGPEAVILATVFSPLSVFRYLTGDELFAPSLRLSPDEALEHLERITTAVAKAGRDLLHAGADGLFLSLFPAGASYLSREEYARFGVPGDRAVLTAAAGAFFNLVHFHAPFPWLTFAREYACQGVSWDAWSTSPDVAGVRAAVAGKVLVGGLDQRSLLVTGSAAAVRTAVHRLKDADAGDLIIASGCAMPQMVPAGNLRAVVDELGACGCASSPPA